jgi:dihydroneopterin aldolase
MSGVVTHFFTAISVTTSIGIHPPEKAAPQRILVDLEYDVRQPVGHADEIADVLDYDRVREDVAAIAGSRHFNLQETLCRDILASLMARPPVIRARVSTRKPDIYPDVEAVGVILEETKT